MEYIHFIDFNRREGGGVILPLKLKTRQPDYSKTAGNLIVK
jgi:hypothetical protein